MTKPVFVSVEERMGYTWITLPGSLSTDNYHLIEMQIRDCLPGEKPQIVIDFSNIHYLYSVGIGLVIRVRKLVLEKEGMVWIVNVNDKCREIFASMKLDKVFELFATDLAFEVSQEKLWEQKLSRNESSFFCVSNSEDGVCSIILSGRMVASQDLSSFHPSLYHPDVSVYLFDLSSLDLIDSNGAYILAAVITKMREKNARCACFGGNSGIIELLKLLSFDSVLPCYATRKEARDALKQ